MTGDGRHVVFASTATNLVPGDTNLAAYVLRHDRGDQELLLTRTGACPGTITQTVAGATPGRDAAIAHGSAGSYTLTIPPCVGLVLDISSPILGHIFPADAAIYPNATTDAQLGMHHEMRTESAVHVTPALAGSEMS